MCHWREQAIPRAPRPRVKARGPREIPMLEISSWKLFRNLSVDGHVNTGVVDTSAGANSSFTEVEVICER
jgi:hypothetical protein